MKKISCASDHFLVKLNIKPAFYFSGIFLFFFLFSCTDNHSGLPGYSGNAGEVIVVMPERYWNTACGEAVKNSLARAQYGLPQDEPVFDLVHIAPKDFARIFQTHRNILIVDISENYKDVKSEIKTNSWAKGQVVIKVISPDESSFIEFMNTYSENIIRQYNEIETDRQMDKNFKNGDLKLAEEINRKYGFSILMEKDFYIAAEDSGFLWLRSEKGRNLGGYEHQVSKGILIYWYNYTDTSMFSPDRLVAVKDSIGKKYIPGAVQNSYMVTSFKLMPPQAKRIQLRVKNHGTEKKDEVKTIFAVEIRGLWRMENDFMGGPFISLSMLDEKKNRIITAEGYVFAPQFDKLNYLREVEAIIKSINIQ